MVRSENLHDGSPGGGRRRAVLLVADLLHPVDDFAVQILGDGEMRSMRTGPVKDSTGPFRGGCEPARAMRIDA